MPAPRRERSPSQLPPGRHGLGRELVAANQRMRLIAAMSAVVAERGYGGAAIDHIVRAAGVSRKTFYEHFESKDAIFAETYSALADDAVAHVRAAVVAAQPDAFADRVVVALDAVLGFAMAQPQAAQVLLVEVRAAGADAQPRRTETVATFTAMLDEAAKGDRSLVKVPPLVSATVVGGIYEAIYSRVVDGRLDEVDEILPDLAYFTLLPYVGADVARKHYDRLRRRRARRAQADVVGE